MQKEIEIENLVVEEFLKNDLTKYDSYGQYLIYCQKKESFFKQLSPELISEFEKYLHMHKKYLIERKKEFVKYVFKFTKKLFNY